MSFSLAHPDDERFFIEAIEPLIANVEQRGDELVFYFRCPLTGFELTSKVNPGDEISPKPSLTAHPRLSGLLENALKSRERRPGTDYSVDEIEEAACDAFELVSEEFIWDGSRWAHWEAGDRVVNFLEYAEILENLDFSQRSILKRVLSAVAMADGHVAPSERELLAALLGSDAESSGTSELPSARELKTLRTRTNAAAVVCFGYAIACVDGNVSEPEETVLSKVCDEVKIGNLKQWEIRRIAQAFIIDENFAKAYEDGPASNQKRLEAYKFGKGLGLTIADLRELEWRFLKRTGLQPEASEES